MTAGRLVGLPTTALDANGSPMPGALLYFYQAGTLTPQPVYAGINLSVLLPNPLAANSAGRWPEIWGDDADSYDVYWTTSGGVNIQQFPDVSPTIIAAADTLLSNLADDGVARTNLGLGSAAVENIGTSGHKVPMEDQPAAITGAWSFTPLPTDAATTSPLGYVGAPINEQDGNYSLVLLDAGKCVQHNSASNHNYTITKDATVAWPLGTVVAFTNIGTGLLTLVRDTGVALYLHGSTTNGSLSIPQYGIGTIVKIASNTWIGSGDVS